MVGIEVVVVWHHGAHSQRKADTHLWTLCQKIGLQIFERWYINRNMEQNV